MTCRGIYLENVDDIPEIELLLYYLGYNIITPNFISTLKKNVPCYLYLYSIGNKNGHTQVNKDRSVTMSEKRLVISSKTYEKIKYISIQDLRSLSKAGV